jgi:hypothetical protein
VELVCADVDGIYASRAATQQDLREPSSRRAHIKANPVLRIEPEMIEGGREFEAAAGHIGVCWACAQLGVCRNLLRRLEYRSFVCCHKAGLYRGLRLRATFKETTVDKESIGALTRCGHRSAR